jgi:hypothetical protein
MIIKESERKTSSGQVVQIKDCRRVSEYTSASDQDVLGVKSMRPWFELWWNSPLRGEILRVAATGVCFIMGVVAGRLWGMWRRYRQKKTAERGVSEDVVTIEKILLDRRDDGTQVMRIRSCGRDPIETVFPNQAARDEFQTRTDATTAARPLVSMEGKMGSYLLQELAIWVCGQLRERGFKHDVWVMAPVYERGALYIGGHFLSTVLLIRRDDLLRFRNWDDCAAIEVEHASHGERILTLMNMAAEYERQEAAIAGRRATGRRANYEETMYLLDLGLDTKSADLPSKSVPWKRFESTLRSLDVEIREPIGSAA